MDCCNYLPYKSPYYGTQQYFEQMPQYPTAEYYNPQSYPDYYGNTPYYQAPHPWQCGAAPFPDYVYNPKEARIRKAMRDASRERAMGVAPSSRGGRRAQPWVVPEVEDQFMMTPSHGMRGVVGSPMCGTGFPLANVGPGQFMQPMHPYNKHMHLMSHETNGYMQTNPMAQLQHQTDMWPQYHQSSSPLRTNQPDQFMLPPSQMPTYHHQPQPAEIPPHDIPPPVDKVKLGGEFAVPETPVSSPGANDQMTSSTSSSRGEVHLPLEQPVFETKVEPANIQQADPYLYHENIVVQNPFEKSDSVKMKKQSQQQVSAKPQKSLPDFNEAFGTTERGRFQSPPDPRPPHKQGYLDYIFTNGDVKFEDYHI